MTQCHCLIIFFKLFFFLYNILNETSITLYWLFFYSKTFMWIKIKNWKSTKWLYIFIIFALGKNVFRQIRKISKNWIWIKKPWKLVRNLNEYFRTCFWFSISISSWISILKLSCDIHVLLLLMLLHLLYFTTFYFTFHHRYLSLNSNIFFSQILFEAFIKNKSIKFLRLEVTENKLKLPSLLLQFSIEFLFSLITKLLNLN